MPAVEATHRMGQEVDTSSARLVLEESVQILCPRGYRTGTWAELGAGKETVVSMAYLGTPVTRTSAPTFPRRMFKTLDQ